MAACGGRGSARRLPWRQYAGLARGRNRSRRHCRPRRRAQTDEPGRRRCMEPMPPWSLRGKCLRFWRRLLGPCAPGGAASAQRQPGSPAACWASSQGSATVLAGS